MDKEYKEVNFEKEIDQEWKRFKETIPANYYKDDPLIKSIWIGGVRSGMLIGQKLTTNVIQNFELLKDEKK